MEKENNHIEYPWQQMLLDAFLAKPEDLGRKINLAESPLDMVATMREVVSGNLTPAEAVKAYHGALQKQGITPSRRIEDDSDVTEPVLKHALA